MNQNGSFFYAVTVTTLSILKIVRMHFATEDRKMKKPPKIIGFVVTFDNFNFFFGGKFSFKRFAIGNLT